MIKPGLLLYSVILFILCQALVWFSTNLQFVNEYWKSKSLVISLVLSLPLTACAYYASRYGYEALDNSAWGVRFLGFGMSYLVFPILTYFLLGESFLTAKVIICTLLSICILLVQIYF